MGHMPIFGPVIVSRRVVHQLLSGRASRSSCSMGEADTQKRRGAVNRRRSKEMLASQNRLPYQVSSPNRKRGMVVGMGRNKGQRRSKDHDERSFKYIQVLVSEVVSSLDALKAIGNGLIER